jgi:hypothetical protein
MKYLFMFLAVVVAVQVFGIVAVACFLFIAALGIVVASELA